MLKKKGRTVMGGGGVRKKGRARKKGPWYARVLSMQNQWSEKE